MRTWPLGLKIGAGVAVVLLTLVLWIGLRRPPDEPVRPIRSTARSQRVQDRLEQLRQDWASRKATGGAGPSRALPGGRVVQQRPAMPEPVPDSDPPLFENEPEFETLKAMATTDPDPQNRLVAVVILATSEDPNALPVLSQALEDADPDVRLTTVEMLGDFGTSEAAASALAKALDDPVPDIRFAALGVLADLGGQVALDAVQKALDDEDADVRALAEGVLDLEEMYRDTSGAAEGEDDQS
jgi:HEAT repeat protein